MIIFLYGPDDYRREQRRRWYVEEFKKKYSGLSVGVFDLLEPTRSTSSGQAVSPLETLKSFLRSESLFEAKKLATIENLYEADEKVIIETLQPFVDKKSTTRGEPLDSVRDRPSRTIVLCSEKKKPVKAFDALLEKPSVVEKFEYLLGAEWNAFVRAQAKKLEIMLDVPAAQFLADVYQGNTWGLVTELEKLGGLGKAAMARKDLGVLGLEVAPNYFAMLNGLKSYDAKSRLWALEKMLAMGDPPPKIFNILASQWREKIPQMAEYDLKIKSGKLECEEALLDLVL